MINMAQLLTAIVGLTATWVVVFVACVIWHSASAAAIKFLLWAGFLL